MSDNHSRPRRIARLAWLFAPVLAWACDSYETDLEQRTAPRLLDRACLAGGCTVEGVVDSTTGLTDDSLGFRLGPGAANLTVRNHELANEPTGYNPSTDIEVLVAGTGFARIESLSDPDAGDERHSASQSSSSNDFALSDEFKWIKVSGGTGGVVISIRDYTSHVDVADIRSVATVSASCSVSRVGRHR